MSEFPTNRPMKWRSAGVVLLLVGTGTVLWAAQKQGFATGLWPFLRRVYTALGIEQETASWLIPLTRKALHIPAYAAIGFVAAWALRPRYKWAFLVAMLVAVCDEMLQSSNPMRHGQLRDLALDAVGAVLGILLARWLIRRRKGRVSGEAS